MSYIEIGNHHKFGTSTSGKDYIHFRRHSTLEPYVNLINWGKIKIRLKKATKYCCIYSDYALIYRRLIIFDKGI